MFAEVGAQHHVPHFHAYYQDEVGIFSVDPVELIAGSLPERRLNMSVPASLNCVGKGGVDA